MAAKSGSQVDLWSSALTSGTVPLSEQPFQMPFVPGQVIGEKYEIIDLLGVGGVGFVISANHVELGERVALKFLRPEMRVREDVVARFAQEALASARIKNEHVTRVFDVGSLPDGTPFIVMEFLEGRDLYDLIISHGALPIKRAVDYVLQACEALADAHACGIVHRDIKPENLFLIERSGGLELIKVLDFGISKVALTGSAHKSKVPFVRTMLPMGSPVYMSPEQIRASKDIDARTDIWSMGCVLHELLTGKAAFDAPSLTQLSATILEDHPPKVSEISSKVPPELDAIVSKCLEKSPDKRYQNMAQLALALYPFGPRRARHSAERCCMLLKVDGATHAEFELPSIAPPGWDGQPSGAYTTTRLSASGSYGEVAPPPPASVPDFRASSGGLRWPVWLGIAAGLAAAAAVAFGVFSGSDPADSPSKQSTRSEDPRGNTPSAATPGLPQDGERNVAAKAATASNPTPRPVTPQVTPTTEPTPTAPQGIKAAPRRARAPERNAAKPAGKTAPVRPTASTYSEPDPGF